MRAVSRPAVYIGFSYFGALLFAICRMFEYGCILQKQDDELL